MIRLIYIKYTPNFRAEQLMAATHDTDLVDLIYDAITDSASLSRLPEAIAAATGSDSSWLMGGFIVRDGGPR